MAAMTTSAWGLIGTGTRGKRVGQPRRLARGALQPRRLVRWALLLMDRALSTLPTPLLSETQSPSPRAPTPQTSPPLEQHVAWFTR
jgi:hypothetical protein